MGKRKKKKNIVSFNLLMFGCVAEPSKNFLLSLIIALRAEKRLEIKPIL
jgi:hypothetical protein